MSKPTTCHYRVNQPKNLVTTTRDARLSESPSLQVGPEAKCGPNLGNPAFRAALWTQQRPMSPRGRTCTVVGEGKETRDRKGSAAPLSDYANAAAYVLIAEPGAGKTTVFKTRVPGWKQEAGTGLCSWTQALCCRGTPHPPAAVKRLRGQSSTSSSMPPKPRPSATSMMKHPGTFRCELPGVTLPEDSKPKEVIVKEREIPSEIKLERTWRLGRKLDEGGFAEVFLAQDENGDPAVVKLVPQKPGTQREMLFVGLDGIPNVVPIIDSGESDGYWVLVMPQAEKSLWHHIRETSGLTTNEAISVLIDIAEALVAVEAKDVVHRDIKPQNILLLHGHWHVADFGIARYAEATTAPDTLKHAMTPPYAAPEQWRGDRATSATDIYAWGVIAYELLAGEMPFGGPDYRHQHLQELPLAIKGIPDRLWSMVAECLDKAPGARPRPENLLTRLKNSLKSASPAGSRLQQANARNVERLTEASRQQSAAQAEAEWRNQLHATAAEKLAGVLALLDRQIREYASSVQTPSSGSLLPFNRPLKEWTLNVATMWVDHSRAIEPGSDQSLPFEVIAYTTIHLRAPTDRREYLERSHSLWYCDAQNQGHFRWYETAFMRNSGGSDVLAPFDMTPGSRDASLALLRTIHTHRVAWPFTPFDQGGEEDFIERWMGWFGEAAQGQTRYLKQPPELDTDGSWRLGS